MIPYFQGWSVRAKDAVTKRACGRAEEGGKMHGPTLFTRTCLLYRHVRPCTSSCEDTDCVRGFICGDLSISVGSTLQTGCLVSSAADFTFIGQ